MWEIAFRNAACSDKTTSKYPVPKDSEAFAVLLIARGKQPYGKTVSSMLYELHSGKYVAYWELFIKDKGGKKTEAAKSIDYSLEIQL